MGKWREEERRDKTEGKEKGGGKRKERQPQNTQVVKFEPDFWAHRGCLEVTLCFALLLFHTSVLAPAVDARTPSRFRFLISLVDIVPEIIMFHLQRE